MHVSIDKRIFDQYPDFLLGIVIASGINNHKMLTELNQLLQQQQAALNKVLTKTLLSDHPYIKSWQEAHRKFGSKPKEYLPSVENIASRVLKGGSIHTINPAVDIYNIISLKYLLPLGGEDLNTIKGNLILTFATENEKPVLLLGEKDKRTPFAGEVIWKDDEGIVCRRWNWKEAERTKLTEKTTDAIFVIEALSPVTNELVHDAVLDLGNIIKKYLDGSVTYALLDRTHPSTTIKEDSHGYYTEHALTQPSKKNWHIYAQALEEEGISPEAEQRIEKVKTMRSEGIEPWPSTKSVENNTKQILNEFGTDAQKTTYTLAGRLINMREHGKIIFADLQDEYGKLQLYFKKDEIGDTQYHILNKFIDIGDIIWVQGILFKTKMGQITLQIKDFTLLSKCLHPLPEKFHGLTDTETRYRQRYLDLITNQEVRYKFKTRSSIITALRSFLNDHGYLEVETPMLHPIAGGAAARPFITHHNALNSDFYLRIAPELYLKRLVIGGFERVYEINRNFRNEGVSTRHNPEFTMVEFYTAYKDYYYAMDFVESLLRFIMLHAVGKLEVIFGDHVIDFARAFKRISAKQALIEFSGLQEKDLQEKTIDATFKKQNIDIPKNKSLQEKIFILFEKLVEGKLIQPTFIIDFPIEISPLSKRDPKHPEIAARFELFISGMEISNGFNELNDPFDQAERFKIQLEAHRAGDEEAHQYDADFIKSLEYALPPTVGVGIGIDRLVMLATNTISIKDVILFPTLKKK